MRRVLPSQAPSDSPQARTAALGLARSLEAHNDRAKAIEAFGVKVEVVKLPDAVRDRLRKAQVRQSR